MSTKHNRCSHDVTHELTQPALCIIYGKGRPKFQQDFGTRDRKINRSMLAPVCTRFLLVMLLCFVNISTHVFIRALWPKWRDVRALGGFDWQLPRQHCLRVIWITWIHFKRKTSLRFRHFVCLGYWAKFEEFERIGGFSFGVINMDRKLRTRGIDHIS